MQNINYNEIFQFVHVLIYLNYINYDILVK